jgi:D-threo-aldose 1-dehydrogenase
MTTDADAVATMADVPPRRRKLGNTRLEVSELGLGGAAIGNLYAVADDSSCRSAVDMAWQRGIRLFDTAPYYGFGLSERRMGDALREQRQDAFVLSTKVGRLLRPVSGHAGTAERHGFSSPMPFEPHFDYSYAGVMRSYEASLHRLGLARIDVLLVHDLGEQTHGPDHAHHLETFLRGGLRALEELRAAGDIAAFGLGVNEWQICEQVMDHVRLDCVLLAGRYTLLEQEALTSFLPRCSADGTSVVVGGAYNSGILATGTRSGAPLYFDYATPPQRIIERVQALEAVCDAHRVPLAAAALQFPLAHPAVVSVVVGAATAERVGQGVAAYGHPIDPAFWSDLKAAGLLHPACPL